MLHQRWCTLQRLRAAQPEWGFAALELQDMSARIFSTTRPTQHTDLNDTVDHGV
jgi:hypothetical protein